MNMEIHNEEIIDNDKYWIAEEIISYIIEYLKKIFPGSIIVREFNDVDIMVLNENLPVELQAGHENIIKSYVRVAAFEDHIRRQIEQNIEISGRMWFFFDEMFLRNLNNSSSKLISTNLRWLYELWLCEKIKIFTITHNGIIREMVKEDWNFLSKICHEDEYISLQKNIPIMIRNVLRASDFTTKEINNMYNLFLTRNNEKDKGFQQYLRRKNSTEREVLYSNILYSIKSINVLNDCMYCNTKDENIRGELINNGTILGLFERNDVKSGSQLLRIRFSDKYDIAKYFPGYITNMKMWNYLKTRWLKRNEFYGIIRGEYHYSLIKKQSTMTDY